MHHEQVYKDESGTTRYSFNATELPGCGQVAVSHDLFRSEGPGGHAIEANLDRQKYLSNVGYSAVLCTVDSSNSKQIHILEKTGWGKVAEFFNTCTEHNVQIWFKSL